VLSHPLDRGAAVGTNIDLDEVRLHLLEIDPDAGLDEALAKAACACVVVGDALDVVVERIQRGCGDDPRLAPPKKCLPRRASCISSCEPAISAPSGQPRPFEKQSATVSNEPPMRALGTPHATAALTSRAPSRCTASSCSRHVATIASISSSGQTRPPELLCVFSTATMRVGGT
jgi:hypothetical protein